MAHDEDPVAHASAKAGQLIALLAAGAEAYAQLHQLRAQTRYDNDERARAAATGELRARSAADRLRWGPLLEGAQRRAMGVGDLVDGWSAARCWPTDIFATDAAKLAEERLRELRPEAMRAFDEQVAGGVDPARAMTDVAWLLDREPARFTPDPPAPRAALTADGPDAQVVDLAGRRAGRDVAQEGDLQDLQAPSPVVDGVVKARRLDPAEAQSFPAALVVTAEAAAVAVATAGPAQLAAAVPVTAGLGRS